MRGAALLIRNCDRRRRTIFWPETDGGAPERYTAIAPGAVLAVAEAEVATNELQRLFLDIMLEDRRIAVVPDIVRLVLH